MEGWGVYVRKFASAVIIDPSHLFRAGLQELLKAGNYRVIASCGDLAALPSLNVAPSQPVLFIASPDEFAQGSGQALRDIRARYLGARIALMGGRFTTQQVQLVMASGAHGCLLTTTASEALMQSLDLIMQGGTVLSGSLRLFSDDASPDPGGSKQMEMQSPETRLGSSNNRVQLSKREIQILSTLGEGASNKVIALKYCLTESTVKVHMKSILRKTGATNRTQAAMWAREHPHAVDTDTTGDAGHAWPTLTNGSTLALAS